MKKTTIIATIAYISLLSSFSAAAQDRQGGQNGCDSSFSFTRPANQRVSINPAAGHALNELYDPVNGFTWETWVYLKDTNLLETSLISVEDGVLYEDIFLTMGWNGSGSKSQLTFLLSSNVSGWTVKVNGSTRLVPLRWYHVAATCDYAANTIALYLNGVNIGSTTVPFPVANRLSRNIATCLGNLNSRNWYSFNGYLDDVKFWKGVRTPAEIAADSAGCISLPQPNLVAYFKAGEGTGTAAASTVNTNFSGHNTSGWGSAAPAAACEPYALITTPSIAICDTSDSVSILIDISYLAPGAAWSVTLSDGSVISGTADLAGHATAVHKVFPAVTTTYYLLSMFAADCARLAGTTTVTVIPCDETTAIPHVPAQNNIQVYPNPAKGRFTVVLKAESDSRLITIADGLGRIVKHFVIAEDTSEFEIHGLAPGMYNVVVSGAQTTLTQRVIIN